MTESIDHAVRQEAAEREAAERAARLLADEVRQRKRVLRYYVAALIVPLALGAYALATGRTDAVEHAADDTRLDSVAAVVQQVEPTMAQLRQMDTVLRSVATTSAELHRQRTAVAELQTRQATLETRVRELPRGAQSTPPRDDVTARTLRSLSQRVQAQDSMITSQRAQITRQTEEIQALRRDQQTLRDEVRRLPTVRPQIDPTLLRRLEALERKTQSLPVNPRGVRPPGAAPDG